MIGGILLLLPFSLVMLIMYGSLVDGEPLKEAIIQALSDTKVLILAFAYFFLTILHNITRIQYKDGYIERRYGRFPPYFTKKIPIDEFDGVRFWFDADGGQPSMPLHAFGEDNKVGAMTTIELSHKKNKFNTTIFRVWYDQWLAEEQFKYAKDFNLPIFVPGAVDKLSRFDSVEALEQAAYDEIFDFDEVEIKKSTSVRYQKTKSKHKISFPYAPLDMFHSISSHPLFYGYIAFWFALISVFQDGFGIILNNTGAVLGALGAVASAVFIPTMLASEFRRRIVVDDEFIHAGLKIKGKRPRVPIDEIKGLCVGRRITRFSWHRGTFGLWAITIEGSYPIALGMSEKTYKGVLQASKKAISAILRPEV
ncbi:MAG: hypothetical protein DHS20C05_11810 [Hyphococcus sp.]|nr:MAG: hypothetical protein DHS20C05_11810 [Marinicaulis sp.]